VAGVDGWPAGGRAAPRATASQRWWPLRAGGRPTGWSRLAGRSTPGCPPHHESRLFIDASTGGVAAGERAAAAAGCSYRTRPRAVRRWSMVRRWCNGGRRWTEWGGGAHDVATVWVVARSAAAALGGDEAPAREG